MQGILCSFISMVRDGASRNDGIWAMSRGLDVTIQGKYVEDSTSSMSPPGNSSPKDVMEDMS
jgi:hypothetical protein